MKRCEPPPEKEDKKKYGSGNSHGFLKLGEEDVENKPYMEICESYAGICIKDHFLGGLTLTKVRETSHQFFMVDSNEHLDIGHPAVGNMQILSPS
ncbi:hypothetical protein HGM15179_003477 [Zosterops borbonicus]|uniref:Uncharacterized protein n=1 Tax=Zosterops borbonicus TaxID=364589 RepID=A0A8K1GT76_9PASS|nr:hypothetical protein HGM15179_003477 [Zosterops borbonicus]